MRLGGLLLQIHPKSYLRKRGWFESFRTKRSVDCNGKLVPWWSYCVADFVEERLRPEMNVLEFGSGSSTVWLASRVRQVVTVENDPKWASIVRSFIPENVQLIERSNPGSLDFEDLSDSNQQFDILIVDALADRIACAIAGLKMLSEDGVVIWDNTDGPDWPVIHELMGSKGFKEISFSGIAPQEVAEDRTTVFYRTSNVFSI